MIKNFILTVLCLGTLQFAYSQEKVHANSQERVYAKPGTEDEEEKEQADQQFKYTRWYRLMQKPNANFFHIQKKYQRYIQRHPQGEGPRETGEGWFKNNIYYLDSKGRVQAAPAVDYRNLRAGIASVSTVTDTMAGDWHITGPRDQTSSSQNTRGGFSYCVRMDPTNNQKMFISFQTGGLWVSSDGGVSWHLSDANMPNNNYYDIGVCAANTNIVYAISNAAVIKSADGGQTWAATGLNRSIAAYAATQGYDIAVSPGDANIVVARWGKNLYRTTDGGTTWASVLASLNNVSADGYTNNTGGILEWSHNDPNQVFYIDAAYGAATATVYSSTNQGATFSSLASITIPADVTAQNLTSVRVVSATDQPTSVFAFLNSGNAYSQLYKIDVSTGALALFRKNLVNNLKCDVIDMDIKHSSNIVCGGYGEQIVHYSTDTGKTFTNSAAIHYDIRSIDIVNGKVMVGNDGETTVSTNGGATFSNVSSSISNIELWGFSSSFKSDMLAVGCNHGPLMVRYYAAKGGWHSLLGADQQNTDINPLDSVHVISRGYGAYNLKLTGIGNWIYADGQIDPGREDWFGNLSYHPYLYNVIESHTAGNFPSPEQNTPTGQHLTWRNSLLRSNDNGLTINSIVHTFNDRLMTEKICMRDTNRIYCIVSPANNHLWKTADGGVTWTEITPPSAVTGTTVTNISDVAVSDLNPNEVWVSYSGVQSTCKVLHSTDGGFTYTNLTTGTLGSNPIIKIVYQRGTNGGVYVGNKSGIFYRNNTMSDWKLLGNGLPMLDVRNMFINYYKGKLLIGTSRGAWDHDLYEHSSTVAQISAGTRTPNCNAPTVQFRDYSVVGNGGIGASYSWTFPGGTPSSSTSETPVVSYLGAAPGSYDVILTVKDQYGTSSDTLHKFINYTAVDCCAANAPGWTSEDIGAPSIAGTTCYQPVSKRFTVQASGADVWGTSDQFRYVDTAMNGNGQIVARVASLNGASSWTKAGVMIRETAAANSKHVFAIVATGYSINMQYRTVTGGTSASVSGAGGITAPYWVKLMRLGNVFTSYSSPDGTNWTLLGTQTIAMNAAVRIGLGVTDHDNTQLATAVFDNVSISSINQPAVSITSPANNIKYSTGSNITINATASSPNTGGSIAKVDLYQGNTLLGTSTTAPYSYIWNNVSNGSYALTAVATDNNGLTTTSSAISVAVSTPPTVSITAPANNAVVTTGSNITINVTASSPNTVGGIAKIDFYNGSALLGTSTAAPYSYTWNNVPAGTDTLKAVATDNNGLTTTSSAITVVVATPPTVSITAPANNAIVTTGSNITINANASSPNTGGGIAKIDFYNRSALLGTSAAAPYSYTWNNVPAGTDTLKAVATDNNGLTTASSAISVVVAIPPTVSITAPANNSVVAAGSNITISATASSPNTDGSIAKVDFYQGGTLLGTSTTSPYNYTWNNVPAGTDTLKAVATDNSGLTTMSSAITVVVSTPPTVSITAPANNAIVAAGSNVTISANASSPNTGGSIAKVDFYQGSTLLGTSTAAPYSYTWNSVANGNYTLTAVATDNNGLITTSPAINIQVEATSFAPAADAYVRNGTYATANYGTATTLVVKSDGTSYFRESYLRFDYSNYTGSSVSGATLKLYVSNVNTDPLRTISLYGIPNITWGETSITYSNQPADAGTLIGSYSVSNTSHIWYQLDVTSYINSQLAAGNRIVSFRIINNGAASSTGDVSFSSREASGNNPELVFTPGGQSSGNNMALISAHPSMTSFAPQSEITNFNITLYPNPSTNSFQLEIKGTAQTARTDIRVMDLFGRTVETFTMPPGSTVSAPFGGNLPIGRYAVEVQQGTNRKVLKMIKVAW